MKSKYAIFFTDHNEIDHVVVVWAKDYRAARDAAYRRKIKNFTIEKIK